MFLRYKLALTALNLGLLPVDWLIIQAKPETLLAAHTALAVTFHLLVAGVAFIVVRRKNRARVRAEWQRSQRQERVARVSRPQ